MTSDERAIFDAQTKSAPEGGLVLLSRRLMSDQLTPVLAYRRLVASDARTAPSFLFESVETGGSVGRYSILGAQPRLQVLATANSVEIHDHRTGARSRRDGADPLEVLRELAAAERLPPRTTLEPLRLPSCFIGGWVGYATYDTVRYLEPGKLPFSSAPHDDRGLPDFQFGLYRQVVVIDHVAKTLHVIASTSLKEHASANAAWHALQSELEHVVGRLETHSVPLPCGAIDIDPSRRPETPHSVVTRDEFENAVRAAQEYIGAGDAFQIVLSQRLERVTDRDPFEIYRALRVVNPSPYQIYLQAAGCILVASSPEILCRVRSGVVTNRPLAGTRRRGANAAEDATLERELLADEKERAEHVMLVDLARNDLGRVCDVGTIAIERCMDVERYSHVMHISSTVTGRLRDGLDCWDALRATLPVGTVSGAPKVRAMQIIDELETVRRGPYAGGIGAVGYDGDMDIALALRTMVIPTSRDHAPWTVHLQAGAGVVLDSDPSSEYEETLNKAAGLGRAIDLAESAFAAR
ncbi:MAG: anthranilate synthase component I [Phycisphaerae bacterium]|nr:anthranilate synthase component I [Phycisphaerae bacterium]MDZ4831359.1 anthranilate synthase component I [Phycisphaerae bacterium]